MEENNNLNNEPKTGEVEQKYNNYNAPKKALTLRLSTLVLLIVVAFLTVIVVLLGIRTNDQHKQISRLKEQLPGSRTYKEVRENKEFKDAVSRVENDIASSGEDIEEGDEEYDYEEDYFYSDIIDLGLEPLDEYLEADTSEYNKDVSKFDEKTLKEFVQKAVTLDEALSYNTKQALTMLNLIKPEDYDRIVNGKAIDEDECYYATNIDYKDFLNAIHEYFTGVNIINSVDLSGYFVNKDGKLCVENWDEDPYVIDILEFKPAEQEDYEFYYLEDDEEYEEDEGLVEYSDGEIIDIDEPEEPDEEDSMDRYLGLDEITIYKARIKETYGPTEYTTNYNVEFTVKDGKLLLNDWY